MIASLAFALAVTFFQKPQRFLGLCGAARARSPAPEATDKVEQRSLGTRAAQKAEQGRLRVSVLGQRLGLNSMHVNQVGTADHHVFTCWMHALVEKHFRCVTCK